MKYEEAKGKLIPVILDAVKVMQDPEHWQKIFAVTNYKLISNMDDSFRLDKDSIDIVVEDLIRSYKLTPEYNRDYPNNRETKAGN